VSRDHASRRTVAARLVAGLAVAALVFPLALAATASLGWSAESLGSAYAVTPRCTTTPLGVLPNLSAGLITSVTVGPLPPSCGGASLQVTVGDGTVLSSGSVAVPGAGGSVTVLLAAAVAVTGAGQTDLVLVGP